MTGSESASIILATAECSVPAPAARVHAATAAEAVACVCESIYLPSYMSHAISVHCRPPAAPPPRPTDRFVCGGLIHPFPTCHCCSANLPIVPKTSPPTALPDGMCPTPEAMNLTFPHLPAALQAASIPTATQSSAARRAATEAAHAAHRKQWQAGGHGPALAEAFRGATAGAVAAAAGPSAAAGIVVAAAAGPDVLLLIRNNQRLAVLVATEEHHVRGHPDKLLAVHQVRTWHGCQGLVSNPQLRSTIIVTHQAT